MRIIHTDKVTPDELKPQEREWVYNGLDCCVTAEVLDVLIDQLDSITSRTYAFSRALQGPVLEMRLRGVLVDQARREEVIEEWYETLSRLESQLETIVAEGLGVFDFNWRSTNHLRELFFDVLGIPAITRAGRVTVDRSALEKLEGYFQASAIVRHILALRDLGKKIGTLQTEIDNDGRCRTSYNIAGTTTGRLSSSFSEFGTGTNLQNIEEGLRSVFIADPGYKLAYFDAEQGESRVVGAIEGNLFRDWTYLDACEGGDLHTNVAKLVWPDLPWTGDLQRDRKLAEQPYFRHYDRRFMCKKIGHGTNYGGKPRTLAGQAKVEVKLIEDFQPKYFRAFPAHIRWHTRVREQLYSQGHLTTLTGRKRWFFGRRNDDSTLREAIAYDPQGSLADILNRGMLEVWRRRDAQLLMQIHDAVLVQYPEREESKVIPKVLSALRVPFDLQGDREFVIPYGVATGWNWGKYCCGDTTKPGCEKCHGKVNLDGLKTWKGGDTRKRTPPVKLMDRIVRRFY